MLGVALHPLIIGSTPARQQQPAFRWWMVLEEAILRAASLGSLRLGIEIEFVKLHFNITPAAVAEKARAKLGR